MGVGIVEAKLEIERWLGTGNAAEQRARSARGYDIAAS